MNVGYRKLFLKDLIKYKSSDIYPRIKNIVFNEIPKLEKFIDLFEFYNIIQLKGNKHRFRIKIGEFRIGLEHRNNVVEFHRFLHRKEFYRYFN